MSLIGHSSRGWARSKRLRLFALLTVLTVAIAACGSGDDGAGSGDGERRVIRLALAPDPVWDYMNDNGMIVEWEEKYDARIVTSTTWDEFAVFAGGHGDIVSVASYELPLIEKETGIKTATFGSYNHLRNPMMAPPDSNFETIADIPEGSKVLVQSAGSTTFLWGMFAEVLHGVNFRLGEGDFELVVNEQHLTNSELVVRGEVAACICVPEGAISALRKGEIEIMYDGRLPWQVYQDISPVPDHKGVMSNMFTSTEEWYNENEDLAKAFLELWQDGLDAFHENTAEIIATYPQHFAVEDPEDIEFFQEFIKDHDWFVESVYLTDDFIEAESAIFDLMKETGFMDEDAPTPGFKVVTP